MSLKQRAFWVVVIFGPLLLLCGQFAAAAVPAPSVPSSVALSFTATEFKFNPNSVTASANSPAQITLANAGTVNHTWVLLGRDGTSELIKVTVKPGQSGSATFSVPGPGSYTFICDIPGHKESGMTGTLTVR